MPDRFLVIQHVAHEDAGVFGPMIPAAGFDPVVVHLHEQQPVPEDAGRFAGILIMGGPMNVSQQELYPFIAEELKLIEQAAGENIPVLGVCLGAQLVAEATGGRAYAGDEIEIGWYDVNLTGAGRKDKLFEGFPEKLTAFQWHGQTFSPPLEGVLLAGSDSYPNQAFRAGSAWGVQFHLEVTAAHVKEWVRRSRDEVIQAGADPDEIVARSGEHLAELTPLAGKMFGRFLELCASK